MIEYQINLVQDTFELFPRKNEVLHKNSLPELKHYTENIDEHQKMILQSQSQK
jgi:hypothetical protein